MILVECSTSTSAPQGEQRLNVFSTPQSCRCFDQDAEDHGTIIFGQIDQSGFGDEATQLDQMARSLAPLHDPVSLIPACYL
jgi:hypothetical protein